MEIKWQFFRAIHLRRMDGDDIRGYTQAVTDSSIVTEPNGVSSYQGTLSTQFLNKWNLHESA